MKLFDPYLDKYPELSIAKAVKLYLDNQLDWDYPLGDD
jgi:hypothetical protein